MLFLNYFPALLLLKGKKNPQELLQYFCSRQLTQRPFLPSQESQISESYLGILGAPRVSTGAGQAGRRKCRPGQREGQEQPREQATGYSLKSKR